MAGVTGLEPAASGVTGRRSNQLSYTPSERRLRAAGFGEIRKPPSQVKVKHARRPDVLITRQVDSTLNGRCIAVGDKNGVIDQPDPVDVRGDRQQPFPRKRFDWRERVGRDKRNIFRLKAGLP